MMTASFLILAVLTIAGATAAMTLRKLVHCALALAVSFVGLAGLFLCLNAQFVGLAQVLVYVGAVVILIVFAILLTHSDLAPFPTRGQLGVGVAVSAAVFGLLVWAAITGGVTQGATAAQPKAPIVEIGRELMGHYVLPLEIVGLLLTAVLIGAVVIAMEEKRDSR
jgi:NADH-quinone oxidoreductase subunit J